jgi:hypothetical protein
MQRPARSIVVIAPPDLVVTTSVSVNWWICLTIRCEAVSFLEDYVNGVFDVSHPRRQPPVPSGARQAANNSPSRITSAMIWLILVAALLVTIWGFVRLYPRRLRGLTGPCILKKQGTHGLFGTDLW